MIYKKLPCALLNGVFDLIEASEQDVIDHIGEEQVLYLAQQIYTNRLVEKGEALTSAAETKPLLRAMLQGESEKFAMLILDTQNRLITTEIVSIGTIDSATVYPRECVKLMLKYNGSAAIFAHNHPSGDATASQSDRIITQRLQKAFALLDLRVLDHFIVGDEIISFAERGYI